jgi:hypothetical protein
MNDLVIPCVGDIWQDANGGHNLVLESRDDDYYFTVLALESGKKWMEEYLPDWNDPNECSKGDGLPFYRLRVA